MRRGGCVCLRASKGPRRSAGGVGDGEGGYVSITMGSMSPHGDACLYWRSAEWSLAILKARGHSMLLHTSGVCDFPHIVTRGLHLPRWGGAVLLYPARVHLGTCPFAERSLFLIWALLPWMTAGSLCLHSRVEDTSSFQLKYTILTARLAG